MPRAGHLINTTSDTTAQATTRCATLVTAFLRPRASSQHKNDLADYLTWAVLLLKVEEPLYVFVEKELESFVLQHRPQHIMGITKIVVFEESDLRVSKYRFWQQQWDMDPEKSYHSIVGYKMWNEKSEFLTKAALDNAFSTSHFFWIDFGFFRDPLFALQYQNRLLNPVVIGTLPRDKVLLLQVGPIYAQDLSNRIEDLPRPVTQELHLAGGLFGGTPAACLRFNELYYHVMERMQQNGRFVGKEQDVYYSLAVMYPSAVSVLVARESERRGRNIWYEMAYFLAGDAAHEVRNVAAVATDVPPSWSERLQFLLRRTRGILGRALAYRSVPKDDGRWVP